MKLEDLKRYDVSDIYAGDSVHFCGTAEHEDGHLCQFKDAQALDAAHKQRELELLAQIEALQNAASNYIVALDDWDNSNKAERRVKTAESALRSAIDAARNANHE